MLVNNTHGWSLSYPASWEPYVMSSPESEQEPSIQQSENLIFDGPQGCYERTERCGHFTTRQSGLSTLLP